MNWSDVIKFIRPELFILVVFVWCLGLFLKKAPWFTGEWKIPFILLGTSVIFTILYITVVVGEGFSAAAIISAIIQGVIIGALSVFGNEAAKQVFIKRFDDTKKSYDFSNPNWRKGGRQ